MKISQILRSNPVTISMEVFPPKSDVKLDSVRATVREIAQLRPAFVSCTYGAGGGTSQYTVEIARDIMEEGVASMAHLTCVSSTRDSVRSQIAKIREAGIENILALRGDIPKDMEFPSRRYYEHAIELVEQIRAEYPDACVGGACYPEKHEEAPNMEADLDILRRKQDMGASYAVTQLFYDNACYFRFVERARAAGIHIPIIPGIKPLSKMSQLTVVPKTFHCDLPEPLYHEAVKCTTDEEMRRVGIEWSVTQCRELKSRGVPSMHFYTMGAVDSICEIARQVY